MVFLPTLGDYLAWHYTKAFRDLFVAWGNISWMLLNFFSVPLLLRTLFSPWKRMEESAEGGTMEDFFSVIVLNMFSRIVGAFIRIWLIVLGIFALTGMLVVLAFAAIIWLLAPLIAIGCIVYGVLLLSGSL